MGVVWTFLLSSILSLFSPSLWETARYRLKYCLKGPLNPKQPTNQSHHPTNPANSKECKIWHKEKEILRVKFTRNVSFPEARKIVESPTPIPGSSYASVIKPTTKHVSFTDATTQTDLVTILDSEESNEKQMSESNNVSKTTTTQTKTTTTAEQTKTTSSLNQGNQASKEQPVLKKATLEMMRKDWQKQQQKERQQNNKPSSPKNKTSNAKTKPQKAQSKKPVVSDRQSKGSKD